MTTITQQRALSNILDDYSIAPELIDALDREGFAIAAYGDIHDDGKLCEEYAETQGYHYQSRGNCQATLEEFGYSVRDTDERLDDELAVSQVLNATEDLLTAYHLTHDAIFPARLCTNPLCRSASIRIADAS